MRVLISAAVLAFVALTTLPAPAAAQRKYGFAGPDVVAVLEKGEGREALAAYEKAVAGAQALRAAPRDLFASFPHPFAWAAFSLTGAPR